MGSPLSMDERALSGESVVARRREADLPEADGEVSELQPVQVHRFTKLGLPFAVFTANFVGGLEIVGGLLLILGLGTRLITIPFIIEMVVAVLSTKPRLFLGTLPLPPPPVPPQAGIWAVLHEIRSEYAQIMSCIFLLVSGPGPWLLDASLLSGEEGKRDDLVEATARRPTSTVRRPSEAPNESWSDAHRVVRS